MLIIRVARHLRAEWTQEVGDNLLQLGVRCFADDVLLRDGGQEVLLGGSVENLFHLVNLFRIISILYLNYGMNSIDSLDVGKEFLLEGSDSGGVHFVEVSTDTAVDDGYLLFDGHGHWKHKTI